MKNSIVCIFVAFLLIISPALADDKVKLIPSSTDITSYNGETQTIDIIIQNKQDVQDTYSILVWPPYWTGVSVTPENYLVKIDSKSNTTVKLYFSIALNAEELISAFNITTKSIRDESITDSKIVYLRVMRKSPIYISDLKLSKYGVDPEEEFSMTTSVANTDEKPSEKLSVQTTIKKANMVVERLDTTVIVPQKSTSPVQQTYSFKKYSEPGTYSVEAVLRDSKNRIVNSQSTTVTVNTQYKIEHKKSVSYGILTQTTTITVKNEGNTPTTEFFVAESVPSFMRNVFYPVGKVSEEKIVDRIQYFWLIPSLMPGEERVVQYSIDLKLLWFVSLVIIFFVAISFRYTFSPKLIKRHRHEGPITRDKEIVVSLDVRNKAMHEIRDVIVRDFVPSIVSVVDRFDTIRPKIRKTEGGTELIWRFESMKPREERVLTYRVKPIVEILGSLKLPKAHIKFLDRKRERKTVASKSVVVKPS